MSPRLSISSISPCHNPTKILQDFLSNRSRPFSLYQEPRLPREPSSPKFVGNYSQNLCPRLQTRKIRHMIFPHGAHRRNHGKHQATLRQHATRITNSDPPESPVRIRDENGNVIETTLGDALDIGRIHWTSHSRPLFQYIKSNVSAALRNFASIPGDFSAHKAYWAQIFDNMRAELVASGESEYSITWPPLKSLEIEIIDGKHDRNGWTEKDNADIFIETEEGITWDDFLKGIRDGLYGEEVRKQRMPMRERVRDGRLVVDGWVSEYNPYYQSGAGCVMRIWMYCVGIARARYRSETSIKR